MALSKIERRAVAETYEDVERLIRSTVYAFHRRYGGDVEEMMADANGYFMKAYLAENFDSSKSKFSTWVRNVVWRSLCSDATKRRRFDELPTSAHSGEIQIPSRDERVAPNWAEILSQDAVTVVRIVLDMPDEFAAKIDKGGDEPTPGFIRKTLRRYLAGAGWASHRIAAVFEEIGKVLHTV